MEKLRCLLAFFFFFVSFPSWSQGSVVPNKDLLSCYRAWFNTSFGDRKIGRAGSILGVFTGSPKGLCVVPQNSSQQPYFLELPPQPSDKQGDYPSYIVDNPFPEALKEARPEGVVAPKQIEFVFDPNGQLGNWGATGVFEKKSAVTTKRGWTAECENKLQKGMIKALENAESYFDQAQQGFGHSYLPWAPEFKEIPTRVDFVHAVNDPSCRRVPSIRGPLNTAKKFFFDKDAVPESPGDAPKKREVPPTKSH